MINYKDEQDLHSVVFVNDPLAANIVIIFLILGEPRVFYVRIQYALPNVSS